LEEEGNLGMNTMNGSSKVLLSYHLYSSEYELEYSCLVIIMIYELAYSLCYDLNMFNFVLNHSYDLYG
jgi:hypothetical protein